MDNDEKEVIRLSIIEKYAKAAALEIEESQRVITPDEEINSLSARLNKNYKHPSANREQIEQDAARFQELTAAQDAQVKATKQVEGELVRQAAAAKAAEGEPLYAELGQLLREPSKNKARIKGLEAELKEKGFEL